MEKITDQNLQNEEPKEVKKTNSMYNKILFAGDTHFQWRVKQLQRKHGITAPVETLKDVFLAADYRFLNLETTLTTKGTPFRNKSYIFIADRSNLELLQYLKIDSAIMGNNHSMDLGKSGLMGTINDLRNAGISAVGAGLNQDEAASPLLFELDNHVYGLLSFSLIGEEMTFAGTSRAGVTRPSTEQLSRQIARLRKHCDAIIVTIHWGMEYYVHPTKAQIKLAHNIIDMGASAVIGHHPHIPHGIEIYKKGLIVYSIGNFLFGSVNSRQNHNMLVQLNYDKSTKALSHATIYPIFGRYRDNKEEGVRLLNPKETIDFWKDMVVQSSILNKQATARIRISKSGIGQFIVQ